MSLTAAREGQISLGSKISFGLGPDAEMISLTLDWPSSAPGSSRCCFYSRYGIR